MFKDQEKTFLPEFAYLDFSVFFFNYAWDIIADVHCHTVASVLKVSINVQKNVMSFVNSN